jgi:hypothetical protein
MCGTGWGRAVASMRVHHPRWDADARPGKIEGKIEGKIIHLRLG